VLEDVEILFLRWNLSQGAVFLHEHQEGAAVNGQPSVRGKQKGDLVVSRPEIGPESLHGVCGHWVDSRERTLQPVDGDACSFEIQIGLLKHPDLRRSEAVTVSNLEDGDISLGLDDREELSDLLLGEELRESVAFSSLRLWCC